MKRSVGMLVIIAVFGMFFITGCMGPNYGESRSSCTVWYGKPGISVTGDQLEVGMIFIHQVTRRPETIGQVIIWEKCGTDGNFTGGRKTTATGGFTFARLNNDSKGYYVTTKVPGAGIAFFKCE